MHDGSRRTIRAALVVALLSAVAAPAAAQIKPASSGQPSFREPEMRRHGSGFVRPNRPHRRHRIRHPYGFARHRL